MRNPEYEFVSPDAGELTALLEQGYTQITGQALRPTEEQQALRHEVGRYEIDSVISPEGVETTNRYTVTIPEAGLVGTNISEMALIDSEGVFAAVKNFLPKGKDADVKFTFEFDDEF